MNALRWSSCLLVFLASAAIVGEAAEPVANNYVVFPIKTPLQRVLTHSSNADVYAQFDVASAIEGRRFDPTKYDRDALLADLAAAAKQVGAESPSLQLYFRFAGVSLPKDEERAMKTAVTNVCREAGFARIGDGMTGEGGAWRDKIAPLADMVEDATATESPVENEFVRVYPVQTKLSRFLLGPNTDCYVEIRQPIDGRFREFSATARNSIRDHVALLQLPQTRRLVFNLITTNSGEENARRYFGRRDGVAPPVDEFVRQLGFESSGYGYTPMNVSPEDMLGKAAPDFRLEAVSGGELHLREKVRGRVALIAFWGVACGACRVEAPYLSALHERYRDDGLTVIAINGYDEDRETVERFVAEKELKHEIALKGRKVATDKYSVASYPVTFLVDHTGAVADYHLGFDPGDERLLEAAIKRLLDERNALETDE